MDLIQAVILSVVQAATEFLPISSSGHLLFLKGLLDLGEVPIIFDIIIHVASLFAIIAYYRSRLIATVKTSINELSEKRRTKPETRFLLYILIATVVTLLFYVLLKNPIERKVQSPAILFLTFLVTSAILFSTVLSRTREGTRIDKKNVLLPLSVGLIQGCAILPGISRAGATISILLLFGIRKDEAAYASFSLAIPAIIGALFLKFFEMQSIDFLISLWPIVLISFFICALMSYLFLVLLNRVLRKGRFWMFGFYTLIMAGVSVILFH